MGSTIFRCLLASIICLAPGCHSDSGRDHASASDAATATPDVSEMNDRGPAQDAAPDALDLSAPVPDANQIPDVGTPNDADPVSDRGVVVDAATPDARPAPDSGPSGPIRSPGCGAMPPDGMAGGQVTVRDFASNGRNDRVYVATIPEDYDPTRTYALTLGLHPGGGRAQPRYDLDQTMAGHSIIVYPQSLNERGLWDKTGDNDIPYIDDVITYFKDNFCIDEGRIFAGGFSQGARMAAALGCVRGNTFRAIAALSAGPPGADMGDVSIDQCVGQTAYLHINGLNDPDRRSLLEYYIAMWRERNACAAETAPHAPEPCVRYLGCADGLTVVQCEPEGLGHMNWRPGGVSPFGSWFLEF